MIPEKQIPDAGKPDAEIPRASTGPERLRELAELVAAILAAMPQADPIIPEGLSGPDAAKLLGVGLSTLHDLDSRGLLPAPVTLGDGRCRRWMRSELMEWMRCGAPVRSRWELLKQGKRKTA